MLLLSAPLVLVTPLVSDDLQPVNKSSNSWACPEYGLDFYGNDITYYENIPTWQECGKEKLMEIIHQDIKKINERLDGNWPSPGRLCYVHKFCSHWTWVHPRSGAQNPRRCLLKNGDGGAHNDGTVISGEESCKSC